MYLSQALSKHNNFDIIRLIASVAVIVSHSYDLLQRGESEPLRLYTSGKGVTLGTIAVFIFFVISGFLITKSAHNSGSIAKYIQKRILRIVPAFAITILVTYLFIGYIISGLSFSAYFLNQISADYLNGLLIYPIAYSLPGVFTTNPYPFAVNGSIWTIPYEFTMYLITIPVVTFGIKKVGNIAILLLLLILYWCMYELFRYPEAGNISIFFMPIKFLIPLATQFFLGAFFYIYREHIILNLWYFIISVIIVIYSLHYNPSIKEFVYLFYPAMAYITIFVCLYFKKNIYDSRKLGDYSYGIYLYGFLVQQLLIYYFDIHSIKILAASAIFCSFCCAFLSWHLVEKPAMQYK
jgi:peptidoglycan/LPS O-acetylase OafA/YrhL